MQKNYVAPNPDNSHVPGDRLYHQQIYRCNRTYS